MVNRIQLITAPLVFIAIVLFIYGTADCRSTSGTVTVISVGSRTISKDNAPAAKNRAVSDALHRSVEQVVIDLIPRSDIPDNLEFLFTTVLKNPQKYVQTYRVLGELKKNRRYMVAVEAKIDAKALEKFFTQSRLLNQESDMPGILLLITEQKPGEILPGWWWGKNPIPYDSAAETAVADTVMNHRMAVVGGGSQRPVPEDLGIEFEFIHDSNAALKLGSELKADIVVLGRAVAEEASNRMGDERSYKAVVALEVFNTVSGERINSVETNAVAADKISTIGSISALKIAGTLAGEKLVTILQDHWSDSSQGIRTIETRISGTNYLSSFITLRKMLNTMEGIEEVQTRKLGSEQALVDIVYQGNAKKFANALMLETFDSFGIEISEITVDSLSIKFNTKEDINPAGKSDMEGTYISE